MMIETIAGHSITSELLHNYFGRLVNRFFKILPMRENQEGSLCTYMQSLQVELLGCKGFIPAMSKDSDFLTMLSILQYLIENPKCNISDVKREVFRAISICNRLQSRFIEEVL